MEEDGDILEGRRGSGGLGLLGGADRSGGGDDCLLFGGGGGWGRRGGGGFEKDGDESRG